MTTAPPPDAIDPADALRRLFGYPGFRPGQEEVVRAVLAGECVLAVMPTGAGKSLCYQLPAMLLPGCTVIISPLVALMKDQIDSLPPDLRERAAVFNSTVEREELDAATADLVAGRLKLVYVAPERLRQRTFLHALARADIRRFVVDEAHCISLWGHDFRPDYLFIPDVVDLLGGPPVLAMTATATPELQAELPQRFRRPLRVVHNGVVRPNLFLEVERVKDAEAKLRRLIDLCTDLRGSGVVYVSSRERAEQVAKVLRRNGISARHYHAGLDSDERASVQDAFMSGRVRVIVATVAFGMGVDKPDVRFIVHFNPSRSLEAYAQESGRAGRDGEPARCILFWAGSDQASLGRWAREDALTPNLLRAVYRAVRRGVGGRFAWWPADRLARAAADVLSTAGGVPAGLDDTTLRVAIGALEQAGVLRRHCDLPEMARIVVRPLPPGPLPRRGEGGAPPGHRAAEVNDSPRAGEQAEGQIEQPGARASSSSPRVALDRRMPAPASRGRDRGLEEGAVAAALGLAPGDRLSVPMLEAAETLGCTPPEVEERLLQEGDAGAITYQGLGRGLLIELLPHPPDLAQRLRGLLDGYQAAQRRRIEEIKAYATGRVCRTAAIAHHFGVVHPRRCEHCDLCEPARTPPPPLPRGDKGGAAGDRGQPLPPPSLRAERRRGVDEHSPAPPDRAPEDIVLECITELPFPMGRTGVTNVLKGSISSAVQADRSRHFGALARLTKAAIEREIDTLIDAGHLFRDERSDYRLLSVTTEGLAKAPAPWPPPRPVIPAHAQAGGRTSSRPETVRATATSPGDAPGLAAFGEDDPRVEERFERLRVWRTEQARAANLPPYTIFHDATLRLLAAHQVVTPEDLTRVKGFGPAKLERYGEAVLNLLCEDESG